MVNVLNKMLAEERYALMGPGRWGSNDINLGVKVTYANINKAKLLVEVAFAKEGYTPEVSYGTHFFQDLVEADIVIVPLFPDDPGAILNEPFLLNSEPPGPNGAGCESLPGSRPGHPCSVRLRRPLSAAIPGYEHAEGVGVFGTPEIRKSQGASRESVRGNGRERGARGGEQGAKKLLPFPMPFLPAPCSLRFLVLT